MKSKLISKSEESKALKDVKIEVKDITIERENHTKSQSTVAAAKEAIENGTAIVHSDNLTSSITSSVITSETMSSSNVNLDILSVENVAVAKEAVENNTVIVHCDHLASSIISSVLSSEAMSSSNVHLDVLSVENTMTQTSLKSSYVTCN